MNMASRTLTPLRLAASARSTISSSAYRIPAIQRTVVSSTKPKPYPSTSSTPPARPAAYPPKPTAAAAAPKPTPSAPVPSRTPIPATSGNPLPDAKPESQDSNGQSGHIDWTNSFQGLGTGSFSPEAIATLQAPIDPNDVEVKPDGIIYLPEIKYRRILNAAFGPGGWGLAPRGQLAVHDKLVTREYALIVQGRFVAQARGEQQYFSEEGVPTAAEGCKSNALMRCCKDLGIASELWDPRFIRGFMKEYAVQQWVEHVTTKKRRQNWLRKDDEVRYPYKKV